AGRGGDRGGRAGGRRAARRPFGGVLHAGRLDDVVPAELLLGFGVGTVLHLAPAVALSERRRGGRGFEAGPAQEHARLGEGAGVGAIRAPVGLFPLIVRARAEVRPALV